VCGLFRDLKAVESLWI